MGCLHLSFPLGKHSYTEIGGRKRARSVSQGVLLLLFGWRLKGDACALTHTHTHTNTTMCVRWPM